MDAKAQNILVGGPLMTTVMYRLQDFFGKVPTTMEPQSKSPEQRAKIIANVAASKAAALSGTLALPPGPLGMLTIIPDLLGVWKIQSQMVADIAGAFGKEAFLSQEQMMYCLFKHTASQALRDIVVRMGGRLIIRRASVRMMQTMLRQIGIKITQRAAGKAASRWLGPLAAIAVGGYAYFDTKKVARSAIELFKEDIEYADEAGNKKS